MAEKITFGAKGSTVFQGSDQQYVDTIDNSFSLTNGITTTSIEIIKRDLQPNFDHGVTA